LAGIGTVRHTRFSRHLRAEKKTAAQDGCIASRNGTQKRKTLQPEDR
jgi:hypothetical protein